MDVKLVLTSREEGRLWVFENRMLKEIFEPKKDEIIGDWRKILSDELNKFAPHQMLLKLSSERR